ncbi:hypothetical protein E8E13_000107 [Curvularia kusanoi]|uniref:AAA+ ATPase domain-containing protein n=1 Tax=Curvularia kusanoi TaxID=90978 RepID=A0A9P4T405_CURKU|nr:hypothetical protein E8E13_000107 [Curvularia kusanoi]
MRLLHHDALGRLRLTDFHGNKIPPYAILSHRWSDSEILFGNVVNNTYTYPKEGYQKLKFCARQAAQDGLQYFWIDTCCIDKEDTKELSEAIQSMFQWYRNAARCYVFLSDVTLPVGASIHTVLGDDQKAPFYASTWFTRGWTLQELIAPKSVEFFSREGQRIGDKASLDQLLHRITKIPLTALRNGDLDQFSISERREWAKNRTTKEEEDIVYCLLGILGISMPTPYNEGRENAERRLQDEIEHSSSAPCIIPFSQNVSFAGRESQIAELKAKLFSNKWTTTMLAVAGPSGTGKSQLALEIAHRTRRNRRCSVFWIDATDEDSICWAYASIARKLGVSGCEDHHADTKEIVKRCVSELSSQQCLIVFDNADSTFAGLSSSSWRVPAPDFAIFLPRSKLCSIIFTTTESSIVARTLAAGNIVWLHELRPNEALDMLQNCLSMSIPQHEHQDAMALLEELSYLPMAITQASACMNAVGMTVQQYREQLAEHLKAAHRDNGGSSQGRNPVAATTSLSLCRMRCSNALAEKLLFFAACVYPKDIPLNFLEAALGAASTRQTLEAASARQTLEAASARQTLEAGLEVLDKYALVIKRPSESALEIHRLVHIAVRQRLQAESTLESWNEHTIKTLLSIFPRDDHNSRSKWRRLVPHALYVLSHTQKEDLREKLDLADKCAMALYRDGYYKEAEKMEKQVMQAWRKELGDKNLRIALCMSKLSLMYSEQGRWGEAEEFEEQAMITTREVLGEKHPNTLVLMGNLACTYKQRGRWKEAEELHVQVLTIRKETLGDKHPKTLISMGYLASTYRDQGQWKEAEELGTQAVKLSEELFDLGHPETLVNKANLALLYKDQGRWEEAKELEV